MDSKNTLLIIVLTIIPMILFCSDENKSYKNFYNRVKADEPYIGFFAAEENCITKVTEEYLSARRTFFLWCICAGGS